MKAPETNGVVERYVEWVRYERLYCEGIPTVSPFTSSRPTTATFKRVGPHEAIGFDRPIIRYLAVPEPTTRGSNSETS